MKRASKIHAIDSAIALFVFFIFALTSLFLVLFGANVYRSVVRGSEENHTLRACLTYVTNKVRQNDRAGAVQLVEQDGMQILRLTQTYEAGEYATYLYFDEGVLWEMLLPADESFQTGSGQEIVQLDGFALEQTGSVLTMAAQADGEQVQTSISLRSGA